MKPLEGHREVDYQAFITMIDTRLNILTTSNGLPDRSILMIDETSLSMISLLIMAEYKDHQFSNKILDILCSCHGIACKHQ